MEKNCILFFILIFFVSCASVNETDLLEKELREQAVSYIKDDEKKDLVEKRKGKLTELLNEIIKKNKGSFSLKINDKIQTFTIEKKEKHSFNFTGKSLLKPFALDLTPDNETLFINGYEKSFCNWGYIEKTDNINSINTYSMTQFYCEKRTGPLRDDLNSPLPDVKTPKIIIGFTDNKIVKLIIYFPASILIKDDTKNYLLYDFDFKSLN